MAVDDGKCLRITRSAVDEQVESAVQDEGRGKVIALHSLVMLRLGVLRARQSDVGMRMWQIVP